MSFIMPPVETRRKMDFDEIIRQIEEEQPRRDMIQYQFRKFNYLAFELDALLAGAPEKYSRARHTHLRNKMEHIITTLLMLGWDFGTPSIGRDGYHRMRAMYKSMEARNGRGT